MNVPYRVGSEPPPELPLGRFLPPIPVGMIASWCRENLKPGDWVLEPFGFSPLIPIEIASAGFPVLVTVNNPIHAFLLQVLASAPQEDELIAALQDLAVTSKGDDRMEPYIRSLYQINCAGCHQRIEADSFLWKKEEDHPYAALVTCPYCGAHEEQTLTDETLAQMTPLPPKRLHHARALNRILASDDTLRSQVENALNAYPTRPLIVLQTIINKLATLEQTPRRRELLTALILSAADYGNTLWAYPSPRNRPRQIVIPSVYQERNLWKVLEEAITTWQVYQKPIAVEEWQGMPEEPNGIYLFRGRLKELDPLPEKEKIAAILTVIPRPGQAFWTLSTLWTGWIWGQEAVDPIRNVLSRQRYDWNWHTNALKGVFETLFALSHPSQKFWGLIAENEPMLLLATLLAANSGGYELFSFAQSSDDQIAQCAWKAGTQPPASTQPEPAMSVLTDEIVTYLQQKGEPAAYQQIHSAAVTGLASQNKLMIDIFMQNTSQSTSEIQRWIETPFYEKGLLLHVAGEATTLEAGDWWLANPSHLELPLIDRVERLIVEHLIKNQTTTASVIKELVNQNFPGIFTPEDAVLLNCLESYAGLVDSQTHQWMLRDSEQPGVRKADIAEMTSHLSKIAKYLGYESHGTDSIYWYEEGASSPKYSFHLLASAIVSAHLREEKESTQNNILVIPGSRANLLAFKKQRDPILKQSLDSNFLVVKFRLLRDLSANPLLSRALFNEQILADPPEYQSSQLALL